MGGSLRFSGEGAVRKDVAMKSRTLGTLSAVVALIAVTLLAGCQQGTPNERQARLFAAQNRELQQQLAARQVEIQTLQQKHAQELRQRDDEIAQCKARIEALQKDLEKGIAERVSGVTTALMDENAKLRKENGRLRAEIEKLQGSSAQPRPSQAQ